MSLLAWLRRKRCEWFHASDYWPSSAGVECRICRLRRPVPWADPHESPRPTAPRRIDFTFDERSEFPLHQLREMGMEVVEIRVGKDIIVQVRR